MSYKLKSITLKINDKSDIYKFDEVWNDITTGKLPILFDRDHNFHKGTCLISVYDNYEADENGSYDFSVIDVKPEFFQILENKVNEGSYKKYDFVGSSIDDTVKKAWHTVWNESKNKVISCAFKADYESIVPPEYSKDNRLHCYLYISIK